MEAGSHWLSTVEWSVSSPGALRLGSVLLHFLWQGTVIAAVAVLVLLALRRARPATRYLVQLTLFGLMALCPVVTWCLTPGESTVLLVESEPVPLIEPPPPVDRISQTVSTGLVVIEAQLSEIAAIPAESTELAVASVEVASPASKPARNDRWSELEVWSRRQRPWFVAVWLAGVALLSLRLLGGLIGVEWTRRRGTQAAREPVQQAACRLAAQLGLRRAVRICVSVLTEVPTLVGWLRPVILLPATALTGLTASQLEAILAHELAHVRRHDALVNLFQLLVETLLFYHPAVWWLSHRIRQEREHCCDDIAIAVCGDRIGYARALAALEELRPSPRWAVAASGGSLVGRIRRMLGRTEPVGSGRGTILAVLAIGLMLLGLGARWQNSASADAIIADTAPAGSDQSEPSLPVYPDLRRIELEIGRVPFAHDHPINALVWLKDGKSLLTASRHGLRIWDKDSRKVTRELAGVGVNDLHFSFNEAQDRIAVLGDFANPRLLEWPSGRTIREFKAHRGKALSLSPDGTRLAVATMSTGNHGNLLVFDTSDGRLISDRRGPPTLALAWSPDSQMLAAGEKRGIVVFFDHNGTQLRPGVRLNPVEEPVSLAFGPVGTRLAVLTMSGTCSVWTMADRTDFGSWNESVGPLFRWIVGSTSDHTLLWTWNAPARAIDRHVTGPLGTVLFDRDGDRVLARSMFAGNMAFEAATGNIVRQEPTPRSDASPLALSPDGTTLARSNNSFGVDLVDADTLEARQTPFAESEPFRAVRLSPDGQTLLCLRLRHVELWNAGPLQKRGRIPSEADWHDASWSPDSRLIAVSRSKTADKPAAVELFDAISLQSIRTVEMPESAAAPEVAFAPGGQRLAVAERRSLSLWNPATGERLWQSPCEEGNWLDRVAVSPNGSQVAAIVRYRQELSLDEGGFAFNRRVARGVIRLFRAADGHFEGELLQSGTPARLEYLADDALAVAMDRAGGEPDFSELVEWNPQTREKRNENCISYANQNSVFATLAVDTAHNRLLVSRPRRDATVASELAVWSLSPRSELTSIKLPGTITDAAFLPQNRLAVLRRGGSLAVLKLPLSDQVGNVDSPQPPADARESTDPDALKQDIEAVVARVVSLLKERHLPAIGERELTAIADELRQFLHGKARRPLGDERRRALLRSMEWHCGKSSGRIAGRFTNSAFYRPSLEELKWNLWVAFDRNELTPSQFAERAVQRKWMRDYVRGLPEPQNPRLAVIGTFDGQFLSPREATLKDFEELLADPCNPALQLPLADAEFQSLQQVVASRPSQSVIGAPTRLVNDILELRRTAIQHRWPVPLPVVWTDGPAPGFVTCHSASTDHVPLVSISGADPAPQPIVITGRCVDEAGNGIPNVRICLPLDNLAAPPRQRQSLEGRTNDRGEFELAATSEWLERIETPDLPSVWAWADGYELQAATFTPERLSDLLLTLKSAQDIVFRIDDFDNQPIPAVTVEPRDYVAAVEKTEPNGMYVHFGRVPLEFVPLLRATTDAAGSGRLKGLAWNRLLSVQLESVTHGSQRAYINRESVADPYASTAHMKKKDDIARWQLVKPAKIVGQLRCEDARSLGGVRIRITHRDSGSSLEVATDDAGRFASPPLLPGDYSVWHEFDAESPWRAILPRPISLKPAETRQVDATLVRTIEATGTVRDQETNEPVLNLSIDVFAQVIPSDEGRIGFFDNQVLVDRTTTDAEGRYRIRIVPDLNHTCRVRSQEWRLPPSHGGIPANAPAKWLTSAVLSVEHLDKITGRLVDSAGQPVAGATVSGRTRNMTSTVTLFDARTNRRGDFTLHVPHSTPIGAYWVETATPVDNPVDVIQNEPLILRLPTP